METNMLALVLALASADPSVVVTAPVAPAHEETPWRAVAFANIFSGTMGVEAPVGPLYVGGGAFGGGARSRAVGVDASTPSESNSAQIGAIAWLQGRFLDFDVVDFSWVTRARTGWAVSTQALEDVEVSSTSTSVSAAVGAIADARIAKGVALRVGVDVVEAELRNSNFVAPDFAASGDDVTFSFLSPHAGVVIDLL
jgi:hypothetical protein